MKPKQIWLIRHGETDWNREHRWQGHEPTELNPTGHEQAKQLAHHLSTVPLDVIYTSDLPRAYQTANPIGQIHGLQPIMEPRFREIHLGIFQGLNNAEIAHQHPEAFAKWRDDDDSYAPLHGESRHDVIRRATTAFLEITATSHQNIAIISHGGTLSLLLKHLLPTSPKLKHGLKLPNTSYTQLQQLPRDPHWEVTHLGEIPHLSNK